MITKTKTLTLRPSFRRGQEVVKTLFRQKVAAGIKIHAIHKGFPVWADAAAHCPLSLRCGKRQVRRIPAFGVQQVAITWSPASGSLTATVDGRPADPDLIARNEGLSRHDLILWFFYTRRTDTQVFTGAIIHFTPFRY